MRNEAVSNFYDKQIATAKAASTDDDKKAQPAAGSKPSSAD